MRRLLPTAAALAALAVPALVSAGCGADDVASVSVAEAAERTRAAETARMTMKLSVSGAGLPIPISVEGRGVTALAEPKADFTLDFTPLLALAGTEGDGRTRVLVPGGPDVFVDPPAVAGLDQVTEGRRWLALDLAESAEAAGLDPSGLADAIRIDPATFLASVRAAPGLRDVGEEEIGGATVTHFRGKVRAADYLRALPPERRRAAERALRELSRATRTPDVGADVDLWVDEEGLVRRLRQATPVPAQPGTPAGRVDVTLDMTDFGAPLDAAAPAADQVTDVTDQLTRGIRESVRDAAARGEGGAAG